MPEQPQETTSIVTQGKPSAEIIRSSRQMRLSAFTPSNLTEAMALAKMMASSSIIPKDYQKKPNDIMVAIQFGSEIGLAPMQSLQSIAVINGRPSIWGDAALALCQNHPDFEDIIETTEGTVAKCVVKRRGRTPVTRQFSDDDAAKAGLIAKGGPWAQYRARMRQMRARGFALRDTFADVLKGIGIAEEVIDVPVSTSPEKRELSAFDLAAMTPSSEPNRGHEDTGLGREKMDKTDEQSQTPAKEAPAMCSECREIGRHKPDCKYAAQEKQTAQFSKAIYMLTKVEEKKQKKSDSSYLILSVVTQDNREGKLYVWHGHLKPHFLSLDLAKALPMMVEVSEQKKDDKSYFAVEHVIEIAGKMFVDDKPAEQSEAGADLFGE